VAPALRLTALIFVANVASMAGASTFAALAPVFARQWGLTNTDLGWITGIYYGGYAIVVPVLVALTDRIDARSIHVFSAMAGGLALLAMAWLGDGFWTALICHAIAGAGLSGTYMPGLKMLTDRLGADAKLRAVAYYTLGFSVGISFSFFLAGAIAAISDWRMAFMVAGCGNLLCAIIVLAGVQPQAIIRGPPAQRHLLDFRPMFKNRAAMGFTLGYAGHSYELMAVRSWLVVFLSFVLSIDPAASQYWNPTTIAAATVLLAMPATIIGAELALKFGRKRVVSWIMVVTVIMALATGASASSPFPIVVVLVIVYNVIVMADSAALTAGALGGARPGEQGATLAVHSLLGFGASFMGPLVVGVALDLAGGAEQTQAWIWAFAAMGAGSAVGLILVRWVAPEPACPSNAGPPGPA